MLKEYKTDSVHYFEDAKGRRQGEAKSWYTNGQLRFHCFFVDDVCHGEYKSLNVDGAIRYHDFYVNGEVYRDLLENPVTDDKDKFLITLETGGGWLC